MKKALILVSLLATTLTITSAQIGGSIQIGNNGVTGGSILIGQSAQQNQVNGGALISLIKLAQEIVSRLGIFAVGLAVLAFFFFLIKFIFSGGGGEKKAEALKGMAACILALFVMVSIWGIVGFLGSVTGIGQGGGVPVPVIPSPNN